MQPLRVFSIIIALLIIIASSSNTSFKPGNEGNNGINTGDSQITDNILLLSIDDKAIFSSFLQTINAEEQLQQEEDQEENGKDSDAVMEGEEEQDRGQSETKSSIGQEQEQQDIEEEHIEDGIKENCRHEEHFDSGIDSCIPDDEKVCDDDRDNDNDGKVDLEDLDCLPNNKNEQVQQQNNKVENEDKEKLPRKEEPPLDYEKDNNDSENPVSIEEENNNNTSSDSYVTEGKAQNNSQNSTNSYSTATASNNNASFNGFHHYTNASAPEDAFTIKCHPAEAEMVPGAEGSITCTIENKTSNPIDLMLECSGLEGTGIECSINGERSTRTTLAREKSSTNFLVVIVSASSPAVPPGSYPFTISAEVCINSDLC
jgi:hypothetical protein